MAIAPKISYNSLKLLAKWSNYCATRKPESPGISKKV
jgi:hypothetical protein